MLLVADWNSQRYGIHLVSKQDLRLRCVMCPRLENRPDGGLTVQLPDARLCYVPRFVASDDLTSLKTQGFSLKTSRSSAWTEEERYQFISGIDQMYSTQSELPADVGKHLSANVMRGRKNARDCLKELRGMLLEDARYDLVQWCAQHMQPET